MARLLRGLAAGLAAAALVGGCGEDDGAEIREIGDETTTSGTATGTGTGSPTGTGTGTGSPTGTGTGTTTGG